MTSDQIESTFKDWDRTEDGNSRVLNSPSSSIETSQLRATLEVAYQLALLNEQIGGVLNSRIPQIRVMCEGGEYPLQVQIQERNR